MMCKLLAVSLGSRELFVRLVALVFDWKHQVCLTVRPPFETKLPNVAKLVELVTCFQSKENTDERHTLHVVT